MTCWRTLSRRWSLHSWMKQSIVALKTFLDDKVDEYNREAFILRDPLSIPHLFSDPQDIEIMGFFSAILAWGQRTTIINKCRELIERMDGAPAQFVLEHREEDLKQLLGFRHRTFNDTDLLYFIHFLRWHYERHHSLESAFLKADGSFESVERSLIDFRTYFFSLPDAPLRTRKHISSPEKKSTCKRLNMFLRWMVRPGDRGVDFGIWKRIPASALIAPCDVHVVRVARHFGLIKRKQLDWQAALELTAHLRLLDPTDPVKYDFALFGLGAEGLF